MPRAVWRHLRQAQLRQEWPPDLHAIIRIEQRSAATSPWQQPWLALTTRREHANQSTVEARASLPPVEQHAPQRRANWYGPEARRRLRRLECLTVVLLNAANVDLLTLEIDIAHPSSPSGNTTNLRM